MEIQFSKHVRIICDLKIGDIVRTDFTYKTKGKDWIIEDIKYSSNSDSGFLVKINGYENYLDSNWLDK